MNQQDQVIMKYEDLPDYQPPETGDRLNGRLYFPYIPDPKLRLAVNLAIKLNRPLLLEGEPGCGKTRLADDLAYQFTQKLRKQSGDDQACWDYYIWNVKSNGLARDGLYRFDAVARLRDAQLVGTDPAKLKKLMGKDYELLEKRLEDVNDPDQDKNPYVTFGPLGNALKGSFLRPIVLIDEIDKADSDFTNDLLIELERQYFEIPETGDTYPRPTAEIRPQPIVIITSNQERQLPEPFLRRCLYYYVEFPDKDLIKIIAKRFGKKAEVQQQQVTDTINHFKEIRVSLKGKPGSKLPGTSELIDFLEVFLEENPPQPHPALEELVDNPHLLGIILKTKSDQELYRKALESDKYFND